MFFEPNKPIPRQLLFELEGIRLVKQNRLERVLRCTIDYPHFDETFDPWRRSVSRINLKIPKLKTSSWQETQEYEKLWIELRYGQDFADVLLRYFSLIERRKHDNDFQRWIGKCIQLRDKPEPIRYSLRNTVHLLWIYGFLWCIDPLDRPLVITRGFGIQVQATSEAIRKIADRNGLKDYSDFPDAYPPAPVKFILNRDGTSQFDYALPGQKFPLAKED